MRREKKKREDWATKMTKERESKEALDNQNSRNAWVEGSEEGNKLFTDEEIS